MSGARCSHCGQEVRSAPRLDDLAVACGMSGNVKKLFWILASAQGAWLTYQQIAEIIWLDDPSGGPNNTRENVGTMVFNLRRLLKSYPIKVEGLLNGRYGYRLVWSIERQGLGYQLVKAAA